MTISIQSNRLHTKSPKSNHVFRVASILSLHLFLFLAPASTYATLNFAASKIGEIPQTDSILETVQLGDKLLFSVGPSGSKTLYSYNGQTISEVDNPLGVLNPSLQLAPEGNSGNALSGVILNGEYYFNAAGTSGTALYKTDGNGIAIVADLDPSSDTGQSISEIIATDTHVFLRAVGPNGRELFRTDGNNTVEFDIVPGSDSSNPALFRRLNNQMVFLAENPGTGFPAVYSANSSGVSFLSDQSYLNTVSTVVSNNVLYWISNDQLYQYDGNSVDPVSSASGVSSISQLSASEVNGEDFVYFSGFGSDGWGIFTWNGSTLGEFDIDPSGTGTAPQIGQYWEKGFYFSRTGGNGRELFRVTADRIIEYDIAPGVVSSDPDIDTAVIFSGKLVFRASGATGNELYTADDTGFRQLADLNPNGDAFPLSVAPPFKFNNRLYFRAFSPDVGSEIFSTDGESIQILSDIVSGPESSNGNFGDNGFLLSDVGLLFLIVDIVPQQPGIEYYLSDGTSIVPLDNVIGKETKGIQDHAGIAGYMGDILYFDRNGQVYRISIIPEPVSIALLISVGLWITHRSAVI